MQHLSTSSPSASIRFGINWLLGLWLGFYRVVILHIITHRNKLAASRSFLAFSNCLFMMVAIGQKIVCLIAGQYVQLCTTKHIFWLGKNKFVRRTAILKQAEPEGWQLS
jgi:hypothetical protein